MKELENFLSEIMDIAMKNGATGADAICYKNDNINISTRLAKIENIEQSASNAYGIRVIVGKKQSIVSSNNMKLSSAKDLIKRAIDIAKLSPDDPYLEIANESIYAKNIDDLKIHDDSKISVNELIDKVISIEEYALSTDGITNSEGANISSNNSSIIFANSNNFTGSYSISNYSSSVSPIAGVGTDMQTDYEYNSSVFFRNLIDSEIIGRKAADRAIRKLNPRKINTQELPVIFEPRIAKTILSNFASAINGTSIAKSSSFLKNKLGELIFSKNINIIDDPKIISGLGSRPFDGEALESQKKYLVKNGILTDYLLDLRSAKKLNLKPNASATRGLSSSPSPSITNLYFTPGDISPVDLIKNIDKGIFLTDLFGMGINIITGDYSQGASGFMIINGEIAYPVSEITIASNLSRIFKDLIVCNDLNFDYTINSPTIMVNNMMIAGE